MALKDLVVTGHEAENYRLRERVRRLRLALEKIGWLDEFLDAHGAKAMMEIARNAVNADEAIELSNGDRGSAA